MVNVVEPLTIARDDPHGAAVFLYLIPLTIFGVILWLVIQYLILGIPLSQRCKQCGQSVWKFCVHDFPCNRLGDRTGRQTIPKVEDGRE